LHICGSELQRATHTDRFRNRKGTFMKPILAVIAIVITTLSAFGESNPAISEEDPSTEHSVMQIEQELVDALLAGNGATFERYLAENCIFTDPDGMVSDKVKTVANIKSGDLKFQSSKVEDMKVKTYSNTAVATYRSTDRASYKGKEFSGRFRWTDVFIRRNGRWQIVAAQGTRISQE
jgi:hypothetical protein